MSRTPPPWRKLGLRYAPPGQGRLSSHAMLPTPVVMEDRIRVLFASCDEAMRGRIFRADLERAPPFRLLHIAPEPVLDVGPAGAFDADGVNPSHVIERDGTWHLYYIGWQRGSAESPYTLLAGLAVSTDRGESFTRLQDTPILPPLPSERFFRTAPFVRPHAAGFEMFYIGGDDFFDGPDGKRLPLYALKHLISADGVRWEGAPETLLRPDRAAGEIGFGRPQPWRSAWLGERLMLSIRTAGGYRLADMPLLHPLERTGLGDVFPPSGEGWEDAMTCFGAPCRVGGDEILFYNGNGMGRTGFGLAIRPAT